MRVVRVDKVTYTALQTVLRRHLAGDHQDVLLFALASKSRAEIGERVAQFIATRGSNKEVFQVIDCDSTFGGGSTPALHIPSAGIAINSTKSPDEIAELLQHAEPPVIGTVKNGQYILDFRTILEQDESDLAAALEMLVKS